MILHPAICCSGEGGERACGLHSRAPTQDGVILLQTGKMFEFDALVEKDRN